MGAKISPRALPINEKHPLEPGFPMLVGRLARIEGITG